MEGLNKEEQEKKKNIEIDFRYNILIKSGQVLPPTMIHSSLGKKVDRHGMKFVYREMMFEVITNFYLYIKLLIILILPIICTVIWCDETGCKPVHSAIKHGSPHNIKKYMLKNNQRS